MNELGTGSVDVFDTSGTIGRLKEESMTVKEVEQNLLHHAEIFGAIAATAVDLAESMRKMGVAALEMSITIKKMHEDAKKRNQC